jgi:hypothetical protein
MVSVSALFLGGAIAGPLFVIAFLVEGAVKPDYDPMRHPVSSLALGPFGWTQTAVFLVAGLLTVAFAAGLARLPGARRKVGAILIGVWGAGLAGAGAFVTDPVSGSPPGTPALPEPLTTSGALHDLFSVPAFFALGAACFVLSAGAGRRWAVFSVLSGAAVLGAFFLSGVGFQQTEPFVDVAGLWQRVSLTLGWTWITALALRAQAGTETTRALVSRGQWPQAPRRSDHGSTEAHLGQ